MVALRKALRLGWESLPISYRAAVKQFSDVVRLDYPKAELYVQVNSSVDVVRARACAKEPATVAWLEGDVDGVFFDIGANVGAYSLVAWAASKGKTRVFAFEPGFSTFPQLCRNIVLNRCEGAVTPLNIALSNKSELRQFKYSRLEGGAASHIGLGGNGTVEGRVDQRVAFTQPMWVHPLDEAIGKFDLPVPNHIKIDVDGHELAVLQGAVTTLQNPQLRTLQIEIGENDPDARAMRELIEGSGFKVKRVSPHSSGAVADYIFVRG